MLQICLSDSKTINKSNHLFANNDDTENGVLSNLETVDKDSEE